MVDGLTYREDFQAWWPDYDHSPEKCFGFVQRGLRDMDVTAQLCCDHKLVVQAGGHAGFWPKRLRTIFDCVITFEPEPVLFECMKRNLKDTDIFMYQEALGSKVGTAHLLPHVSAGSWRIDAAGTTEVAVQTIDNLKLQVCDAIILDIEGYEVPALNGAMETIQKLKPVLHVEELPRAKEGIRHFMSRIGYKQRAKVHNDFIYCHP